MGITDLWKQSLLDTQSLIKVRDCKRFSFKKGSHVTVKIQRGTVLRRPANSGGRSKDCKKFECFLGKRLANTRCVCERARALTFPTNKQLQARGDNFPFGSRRSRDLYSISLHVLTSGQIFSHQRMLTPRAVARCPTLKT